MLEQLCRSTKLEKGDKVMRKILLYMLVICLSIGWIPYSAEAEEQTLHLLDFFSDENDEKVEALFHEMYPDVKVVRDYTDDPRIILHRVLSGDEDVDIIMFSEGLDSLFL